MNTSSLKSSNGISETRESCQQLSHQRRGPACSLAIIVPPWIVNPAERPSEIITAPRDVATARGATRRSIYKTTHLPPRKKTLLAIHQNESTNSSISFLCLRRDTTKRERKKERKKGGKKETQEEENKNFGPGSSETIKRATSFISSGIPGHDSSNKRNRA